MSGLMGELVTGGGCIRGWVDGKVVGCVGLWMLGWLG